MSLVTVSKNKKGAKIQPSNTRALTQSLCKAQTWQEGESDTLCKEYSCSKTGHTPNTGKTGLRLLFQRISDLSSLSSHLLCAFWCSLNSDANSFRKNRCNKNAKCSVNQAIICLLASRKLLQAVMNYLAPSTVKLKTTPAPKKHALKPEETVKQGLVHMNQQQELEQDKVW